MDRAARARVGPSLRWHRRRRAGEYAVPRAGGIALPAWRDRTERHRRGI